MRDLKRGRLVTGLVLSLALVGTACSSDDTTTDGDPTPATSDQADDMASDDGATGAAGTVPIAGSSTVGPISQFVAEDFGGDAAVEITGTGGGFKDRFCLGQTAINNASRTIKDEELALCAENGIENILELKVGIDGMTVMTSQDNDTGIECVNFNEIYALVGPESGDVASWSDANDLVAELGGGANDALPEVELTTAGPGTESGTYDSFYELAIEGMAGDRGIEEKFRPDWTGNNDDNVIIQGIAGNQYSFGWVGFAYFTEVSDQVRAFDVQDEDGNCVTPTPESIATGEYPLSRDLYVYVNLDMLEGDFGGTLESYVDYYLSADGYDLVAEAGYVQLTDDAWAETQAAWDARTANV